MGYSKREWSTQHGRKISTEEEIYIGNSKLLEEGIDYTLDRSFIILNNELLDQAFDDILQSKIDCDNLCGVYTNKDINKTLMIYYDPKGTQYKMSINSE